MMFSGPQSTPGVTGPTTTDAKTTKPGPNETLTPTVQVERTTTGQ